MAILFENVFFSYDGKNDVLKNININIEDNSFIGLIGKSGSGKTTFVQQMNALLKPTKGKVLIDGIDTTAKKVKELREKVGMVFQYPEHQLFEETVYKDIAFGLRKKNLSDEEKRERVSKVIKRVGLEEDILERSPFELSGGQKRRVAIAGVLVMEPQILILDEPSAGLDPDGKKNIYDFLYRLWQEKDITIILISHNMEDIAKYTEKAIVMEEGEIKLFEVRDKIFRDKKILKNSGLDIPVATKLMEKIKKSIPEISDEIYTVDEAVEEISKKLRG